MIKHNTSTACVIRVKFKAPGSIIHAERSQFVGEIEKAAHLRALLKA